MLIQYAEDLRRFFFSVHFRATLNHFFKNCIKIFFLVIFIDLTSCIDLNHCRANNRLTDDRQVQVLLSVFLLMFLSVFPQHSHSTFQALINTDYFSVLTVTTTCSLTFPRSIDIKEIYVPTLYLTQFVILFSLRF